MKQEESNLQAECVRWFRLTHPQLSDNLFSVPNGGFRHYSTALAMKREGQLAGVSDLILLYPSHSFHGLLIEMKSKKGRLSKHQKSWLEHMSNFQYGTAVCHSFDEFRESISNYLRLGQV